MTTTAQRLSAAAAALSDVVSVGHDGLSVTDLMIAGQARDQALACLTIAQRYLFAGRGHTTYLSTSDYLRHPVLGLEEALRRRRPTGLTGPSPTDLAVNPPTHPTTLAWTVFAREIDAASLEISRARPDNPSWAWQWSGLAPNSSTGRPPPGSPDVAWGLAGDLAALSLGLTAADEQLAQALATAQEPRPPRRPEGQPADRPADRPDDSVPGEVQQPLASAHAAVVERSLTDLRVVAGLALRLAESGPLPTDYHLPLHAVGLAPLVPAAAVDLPPALRRAQDMLNDGPPLTHIQHRTLAVELTRTAVLVARLVDEPATQQALLRLAQGTDNFAKVWATSTLFALTTGSQAPGDQVHTANAFLISSITRNGDRTATQTRQAAALASRTGDVAVRPAMPREVVEGVAALLPGIALSAADNARRGMTDRSFVAVDRLGDHYRPAERAISSHPEGRRYKAAAAQLHDVASGARQHLPQTDPVGDPVGDAAAATRSARDLLRAVTSPPPLRPSHPALPPPLLRQQRHTPPRPPRPARPR